MFLFLDGNGIRDKMSYNIVSTHTFFVIAIMSSELDIDLANLHRVGSWLSIIEN